MELNIQNYIRPGARAHLVGIGGVSMSPLAEVLHGRGVLVTGSDMHESAAVSHLRAPGHPVTIGHLPQSVEGATASFAPPPSTTIIRRLPRPCRPVFQSLSVPRPGGPS